MNYNYRPAKIYMNKLEAKIKELEARITKAIELLERYNDRENNYYVPVTETIDILKGSDSNE